MDKLYWQQGVTACVCDMCVLSLLVQTVVGSVDSSHADLCVRLAASYGRANGGLCGSVGSYSAPVDPGSPVGATDLTPATARGKDFEKLPGL